VCLYENARRLLPLLLLSTLTSCGGSTSPSPPTATSAFDLTTTLSLTPRPPAGGYWPDFPTTHESTLVFDPAAKLVFMGARGQVVAAETTTTDGQTYRTTAPLTLPIPFNPSCNRLGSVTYDQLAFTVRNGALEGTATGSAQYVTGDQAFLADLTATLAGVPDITPPTLDAPTADVDPLAPPTLRPSEPLPPTAKVTLSGSGGDVIVLQAGTVQGTGVGKVVTSFAAPGTALRSGSTYTIQLDGVVDFAGKAALAPAPFTTRAAPPLIPEDGFESVATATLGGAGVLRGEPLTPIAGTTSLILNTGVGGGFGFLPYMLGPSLAVRLPISPGDTAVHFERRIAAVYDLPTARFYGSVRLASPGGTIAEGPALEATGLTKLTLSRDGDLYLSPVETITIPLPPDAVGELLFEIDGQTSGCGLPPPPTAVIIDDLRVE
jgi:hypothetical protein